MDRNGKLLVMILVYDGCIAEAVYLWWVGGGIEMQQKLVIE